MVDVNGKTRINLNVWVRREDGFAAYFTRHIGFFPPEAVDAIVSNMDVRHIAFHSGLDHQIGRVDVATCPFDGETAGIELIVRTEEYGPPEPLDPCLVKREPDEPMFVLLARDSVAPAVMEHWCLYRTNEIMCHKRPDTPEERQHIADVRDKAMEFRDWRRANRK